MDKQCLHKNIIITEKSRYRYDDYIKQFESENHDSADHFIESEIVSIFCEDCGENLE